MTFSKWHALGNAYLLVERHRPRDPLTPELVRRLCDGSVGIGSDGVVEVVAARPAAAELVIWNPDGSIAELSGNGARIAAAWLSRRSGTARVELQVGDRSVRATMLSPPDVALEVGTVEVGAREQLELEDGTVELTPVSVGNPHAVIEWEPRREELLRLGPLVECHPRFPARTNVQLVRRDGPHELTVAVWERGAGETRSSGTSSVAAAAVAIRNGWCRSPVTVHLPGGHLRVELDETWRATLTGPAEEICQGELARDFLA